MVHLSNLCMTTGKTIAFDYMDPCQQSDVSVFIILSKLDIVFLPRRKSFNFMVAVTVCGDFEAQEKKKLSFLLLFPLLFARK